MGLVEFAYLTAIVSGITLLTFLVCAKLMISHEKKLLFEQLHSFFDPVSETEPSQFGQLVSIVSKQFASDVVKSVTGSLMGTHSGTARSERALEADFQKDLLSIQNPTGAALLSLFPSMEKRIRNNPALMPLAQQILANFSKGGGNTHKSSTDSGMTIT